ncbi:helix-turn-helix transcriptional regulator [Olivibacter sitiensis]|uniref:helix-turn-helix transcriptional regulator n=1 Tax=Olivibacter sitiensis TaxID=376470 RepID=UPI000417D091|nr:YafY family protein [Olivibacter sitiensis]
MTQQDTIKRFDRIVAIFVQLQSKRIVKAQELADRFDVSIRTIYRDIKTLESSGIPIYGEAGSGYSLVDDYRLPPMRFSQEEVASFIAADKLMQKYADGNMQEHFASSMFKIRALLRSQEKEQVTNLESKVIMKPRIQEKEQGTPNALTTLFESIARKTQVLLLYQALNADTPSERLVEPVGIFHQDSNWHMIAYCLLRQDYRQFRTDRIHDIKLTEQSFQHQHQPLSFYLNNKEKKPTITTKIVVPNDVARHLSWERSYFGFVEEELVDEKWLMTFEVTNLEGFARWFVSFGDRASIIEPDELIIHVRDLIDRIGQNLKNNVSSL